MATACSAIQATTPGSTQLVRSMVAHGGHHDAVASTRTHLPCSRAASSAEAWSNSENTAGLLIDASPSGREPLCAHSHSEEVSGVFGAERGRGKFRNETPTYARVVPAHEREAAARARQQSGSRIRCPGRIHRVRRKCRGQAEGARACASL